MKDVFRTDYRVLSPFPKGSFYLFWMRKHRAERRNSSSLYSCKMSGEIPLEEVEMGEKLSILANVAGIAVAFVLFAKYAVMT